VIAISLVCGAGNVMRYVGMMSGKAPLEHPEVDLAANADIDERQAAECAERVRPEVEPLERVTTGPTPGTIRDESGEAISEFRSHRVGRQVLQREDSIGC
jgi:hypothetical protein